MIDEKNLFLHICLIQMFLKHIFLSNFFNRSFKFLNNHPNWQIVSDSHNKRHQMKFGTFVAICMNSLTQKATFIKILFVKILEEHLKKRSFVITPFMNTMKNYELVID